ncbi:SusC/RagA family TonB-linked outer membrane protein [Wenyingzhuangia sp. 2_MG-2023]|nr:SusC/RagA family TonB-linked outer membrane protein [Wenyingzhuangia sp. 2_MG-2023]MDO6738706.1 SusC/RagA family TonB-linked outer membrane protein [Wenyingzhuangia sp. 2_MG-2023]
MKLIKHPFVKMVTKLSVYLAILFFANPMLAKYAFGQGLAETKISILKIDATPLEILKEVESKTEYHFIYDESLSKIDEVITVKSKDISVLKILEQLTFEAKLKFKRINNNISVQQLSRSKISLRKITGVIIDEAGEPLPAVDILEKGTSNHAISDFDGNFKIQLSSLHPTLIISYNGFITQEIAVENKTEFKIVLKEDITKLNEVVVTALNITREEKSLGYSVAKVKEEDLTKTVTGNWINGMSGKVAGLTFDQAGTGPSGSVRVTLRGDQSLNYGSNEALFVVDGVPITSGITSTRSVSNYAQGDAPIDYGNGISDLNPDDIASVSILKGPTAAALYGSRAGGGAILITTKSGKKTKGIGVSVNSSITFDKAGYFPDFQTEYGNGSDMGESEFSMWELTSDMTNDGIAVPRHYSRYTFGEKFDENKLRYLYASKDWDTGEFTKLPYTYKDDWYTGLFQTGVTKSNTISISGNNGNGTSTRFSVTDFKNEWILPNTGFDRKTVSLSLNTPVTDRIKLNTKINYVRKQSDNMPGGGYNENNPMYALTWGFNVNSINDWKNEYFQGRYNYANWNAEGENGQGLVFPSKNGFNPYRSLYEELNTQDKNRVFGNIGFSFDIMKGLVFKVNSGLDWSDEFRTQRRPFYTADYQDGFYREQTVRGIENNNEAMLSYTNNNLVQGKLGVTAVVGANNRVNEDYNSKITLSQLGEEGIYHTTNLPTGVIPDPYNYRRKKVVNSLYGLASLSWDNTYYLDITGRNDWSSTLSKNNRSFFYPSVAASILMSEIFDFRKNAAWIDFTKLRLSWANVGNDTNPYSLDQYYSTSSYPGGYTLPGTIPDPEIKPENVESWEAGLEAKMFKNRVAFDVTLYKSSTTNQIVSVGVDQATGATGLKINAGEISNQGIEVSAHFVPIRNRNFEWSFDINWSKNKNKLVSLQDDWDPNQPLQTEMGTTIGGRVNIYSYVGQQMHVIYGRGFQRAPEGSTYVDQNGQEHDASGMHLVNADGYPILDEAPDRKIGNVNPDWRGGVVQRFRYKNFSLTANFTGQYGGNTYSVTNFALSYQGKLNNSLEGRYDGLVHNGVNVVNNTDGTISYTENTNVTKSIQTYYNSYIWNRNNAETNTFSNSYLKLRELRLDYKIPQEILKKTGFLNDASLGVFATNLFTITEFPQYDPETGMLNGSDIYKGIETMSFPMTRSYGFNVKFSF